MEGGSDIYRQTSRNLKVNVNYVDGRALDLLGESGGRGTF